MTRTQTQDDIVNMEARLRAKGVSVRAFLRDYANNVAHETTWGRWKRGECEPDLGRWRIVLDALRRVETDDRGGN